MTDALSKKQQRYVNKMDRWPTMVKMRLADGLIHDVPRAMMGIDCPSNAPRDFKIKRRRVKFILKMSEE